MTRADGASANEALAETTSEVATLFEGGAARAEVTLAALLAALGEGRERLDEGFAREVAARLASAEADVRVKAAERLGLEDVVVTFHMDRSMRLVVTGHDPESGAEVTLGWRERDFDRVVLHAARGATSGRCTFATLDFSVRGARAILRRDIGGAEVGDGVVVRCLATLGDATHYRVTLSAAGGGDVAVAPQDLTLVG